jgi:hypothetical protein
MGTDSIGKKIFFVSRNVPDSEEEIFSENGKKSGICNYFTGEMSEYCRYREKARLVYRCHSHISGKEAVDVYHVSSPPPPLK